MPEFARHRNPKAKSGERASLIAVLTAPIAGAGLIGVILPRSIPSTAVVTITAVALFVVLIAKRRQIGTFGVGIGHLVAVTGLTAFCVAVGPRVLGWPNLFPVAKSVDAAHHGAMVDWIARNGRLPSRIEPELRQFSEYFLLPHRLVALICSFFGVSPMRALGVCGLLALGIVLLGIARLADRYTAASLGTLEGHCAAFLVFPCAFLVSHFTIGSLAENYFFGQMVALAFGLAACVAIAAQAPPVLVILSGAASIAAYPLQAPLVPGVLVILGLLTRDRRHLRSLAGVLGVGIPALLVQYPYLGASRAMSTDEGSITTLTLSRGGGILFGTLVGAGVFSIVRSLAAIGGRTRTGATAGTVVLGGFALTVIQHIAFRAAASQGIVSNYAAGKIIFMVAPFAVCLAAIGAAATFSTLLRSSTFVIGATALCGILLVASDPSLSMNSVPPMRADAYALARWVRDRKDVARPEEVGVVGDGLTPYSVRWAALGSPIDYYAQPGAVAGSPWRNWPVDSTTKYVIVVGARRVETYVARPGVRLIARRGSAVLLMRDAP